MNHVLMDEKPSLDDLVHYGIKGMKWGVRRTDAEIAAARSKKKDPNAEDRVLKKGQKVYNISADKARELDGHIYTAHKKRDVLNYRGGYAKDLTMFRGADKAFSNAFTVSKDIRIAGKDAQLEAFKSLWEKDKDGVARALAESQKDIKISAAFNARVLKMNREDKYYERFRKKGDKWVASKGYNDYISSLSAETDKSRKVYFEEMRKRGYNAILDMNDVKNYGSEEPLLIFNGKNNLGKRQTVELTEHETDRALEAYTREKKLDEYRDTLHT